jgi:D-proline reductase (dithiol) PrdB
MPSEPIKYIDRTRAFYSAQDFTPYNYAHHESSPFHRLQKPLSECRVAIVLTAVTNGETPKNLRGAESHSVNDAPENFRTDELSWDKITTHTDDRQSFFPLEVLQSLENEGVISSLAPRYHFVPTEYSQRNTRENDAPAIRDACINDEVDIVLLIPL